MSQSWRIDQMKDVVFLMKAAISKLRDTFESSHKEMRHSLEGILGLVIDVQN